MSPRGKSSKDVVLLQRKIKHAKRFQREFQKHIQQLEGLLKLAKSEK